MTVRQTILLRRSKRIVIVALIAFCIFDYARVFGYQGDDWKRFNGATVTADQVIDGRTFRAGDTTIRLIGIASTPSDGGAFLRSRLTGHPVRIALDQPQTRDESNALLASCYLSPRDCLNVDCISDGVSRVDPTYPCSIAAELDLAAAKVKRKLEKVWRKSH